MMEPDHPQPQSAVQGVTTVATGAIDALKTSPALLVLVLMQIITMAVVYFNASKLNEQRHEREMLMLNKCVNQSEVPRRSSEITTSIGQMQGPPAPEKKP